MEVVLEQEQRHHQGGPRHDERSEHEAEDSPPHLEAVLGQPVAGQG